MSFKRLILTPGDALARRFDRGYAKFMVRMRCEIKKGNRRLAIYSLFARAEWGLAFAVGASARHLREIWGDEKSALNICNQRDNLSLLNR